VPPPSGTEMSPTAIREFSLLIDVGNTFLKWGLFRAGPDGGARANRVESGHALHDEIMALPAQFAKLPTPAKIVMPHTSGSPPDFTASSDGAR